MFRLARRLPLFRIIAIAQVALAARRHLQRLAPGERRRMAQLVRRGRGMTPAEREELRELVGKLDARAFALGAVDAFSPLPVRRFMGRR